MERVSWFFKGGLKSMPAKAAKASQGTGPIISMRVPPLNQTGRTSRKDRKKNTPAPLHGSFY
jgi:hypothetical protein